MTDATYEIEKMSRGILPRDVQAQVSNNLYNSGVFRADNLTVSIGGSIFIRPGTEFQHGFNDAYTVFNGIEFKASTFSHYVIFPIRTVGGILLQVFKEVAGRLQVHNQPINTQLDAAKYNSGFWSNPSYDQNVDVLNIFDRRGIVQPIRITRNADDTFSVEQWTPKIEGLWQYNTEVKLSTKHDPAEADNPNEEMLPGTFMTWESDIDFFEADQVGMKLAGPMGPEGDRNVVTKITKFVDKKTVQAEVVTEIPVETVDAEGFYGMDLKSSGSTFANVKFDGTLISSRTLPRAIFTKANDGELINHRGDLLIITSNAIWKIDPNETGGQGDKLRDISGLGASDSGSNRSYAIFGACSFENELYVLFRGTFVDHSRQSRDRIYKLDVNGAATERTIIADNLDGTLKSGLQSTNPFTSHDIFTYENEMYWLGQEVISRSLRHVIAKLNNVSDSLRATTAELLTAGNYSDVTSDAARDFPINARSLLRPDSTTVVYGLGDNALWRIDMGDITLSNKIFDFNSTINGLISDNTLAIPSEFRRIRREPNQIESGYKYLSDSPIHSVSAWGFGRGWPRCGKLNQGRYIVAGTQSLPHVGWASIVDDPENYTDNDNDDQGFTFEVNADGQEFISEMVAKADFHVLCESSSHTVTSGIDLPLAPGQFAVKRQNSVGIYPLKPRELKENIIYLSNDGVSLRFSQYNESISQYVNVNLSEISPNQIINPTSLSVIEDWNTRLNLIFITLQDGNCVVLTLNNAQEIQGWTIWETANGRFKHSFTLNKDLYFLVERNGQDYIEKLSSPRLNISLEHYIAMERLPDKVTWKFPNWYKLEHNKLLQNATVHMAVDSLTDLGTQRTQLRNSEYTVRLDREYSQLYVGLNPVVSDFVTLNHPFINPGTGRPWLGDDHDILQYQFKFEYPTDMEVSVISSKRTGNTTDQGIDFAFQEESEPVKLIRPKNYRQVIPGLLTSAELDINVTGIAHALRIRSTSATEWHLNGFKVTAEGSR